MKKAPSITFITPILHSSFNHSTFPMNRFYLVKPLPMLYIFLDYYTKIFSEFLCQA